MFHDVFIFSPKQTAEQPIVIEYKIKKAQVERPAPVKYVHKVIILLQKT